MSSHIAEKLLNISRHELPRTAFAWGIRLLHQTGYIIGFTAMTAIFVTKFSVAALPVMFLIQAALTIVGMILFSFLNEFFSTKFLLGACSLLGAFCLFSATLNTKSDFWFFGFLFLAMGIFIPQLTIFLSSFLEDFFSPLEGERIFPLIESAQTFGGIFGGILITSLSLFFGSYKFFYVWILFLFLLMSVVLFLEPVKSSHHLSHPQKHKAFSMRFGLENFKNNFLKIKAIPFLQALFIIFLLQWVIGHLLEFQYTKVIEESINHAVSQEARAGSLTHGLGSFEILFNGSALIVQLLLASRLLKNLGIAGSFLLHAVVTFLSAVSLFAGFGYFTLILAKNNFEISGIVHNNAYEASYYALRHGTQKTVREFFEAFLYPLGTMIGTLLLLGIQAFFLEEHSLRVIQFFFLILAMGMVGVSFYLQKTYTELVTNNLFEADDQLSKLHAIEILSQKGHTRNIETLLKGLHSPHQSLQVKIKILSTLGKIGDSKTITEILAFFHHHEPLLVLAAVKALESFPKLGEHIFTQAFARYRVIHELKDLFVRTQDEQVRMGVIKTLAQLQDQEIVQFLLDTLHHAAPMLQAVCIRVCALFKDENVVYFLEPYLKSHDPQVKAQTIIALWPIKYYRHRLHLLLQQLLTSEKQGNVAAALFILGEIGEERGKKLLLPYLTTVDTELRLNACFALLKLGYKEAASYFIPLLLNKRETISKKAHEFLFYLKPDTQRFVTHLLKREVSRRLHYGLQAKQQPSFFTELLEQLKNIYVRIESYHEADYIEHILQNKLFSEKDLVFETGSG